MSYNAKSNKGSNKSSFPAYQLSIRNKIRLRYDAFLTEKENSSFCIFDHLLLFSLLKRILANELNDVEYIFLYWNIIIRKIKECKYH